MAISFECNPVPFVAFSIVIASLLFIITICTAIFVIYKFCAIKDSTIENVLKYLCITAEVLCTIGVGPGFFFTNFWKHECTLGGQLSIGYYISTIIVFNTYPVALTCLYGIFAYRIYFTFVRASMYSLSKSHKNLLIGTFIFMAVINLAGSITSFINLRIALIFLNLDFILSMCSSVVLLYVFYQKMKHLTKLVSNKNRLTTGPSSSSPRIGSADDTHTHDTHSDEKTIDASAGADKSPKFDSDPEVDSGDENATASPKRNTTLKPAVSPSIASVSELSSSSSSLESGHFNTRQIKLINVTGKLSLLVFLSLMSTLTAFFINVFNAILDRPYYFGTFAILSCGLDITVNAVCLMLQWPFAKEIYHKVCLPCHKLMMRQCSEKFEKYMSRRGSTASEFDL